MALSPFRGVCLPLRVQEYFNAGARWIAAPRPELVDTQFHGPDATQGLGTVTEFEPTFDAADFLRFGVDVVGQLSNVTNSFGVEWLRRHLPAGSRLVLIEPADPKPMHIDATLMPLSEGKLLVNGERLPRIPDCFRDWEVRTAPYPAPRTDGSRLCMSSAWISMNVLSLADRRVVVEAQEDELIAALRAWSFEPIPCRFRHFQTLGGSFHCATLDVRRRGPVTRSLRLPPDGQDVSLEPRLAAL